MSDLSDLKTEYLSALAADREARQRLAPLQEELDRQTHELVQQWQEEHGDLIAEYDRAAAAAAAAEERLRRAVVEEYVRRRAQGDDAKQLGDGLRIRVTSKLRYDEGAAVAWADVNAPFLIKRAIDAKQFESIVKNLAERPAFVEIEESVAAVLALP